MKKLTKKMIYLSEYYNFQLPIVNFGYWLAFPYDEISKKIDNKDSGFFELIVKKFNEIGIKINYINLESKVFESPKEISKVLRHNLSIADMKHIREVEYEEIISDRKSKRKISKNFANKINVYGTDYKIKINSLLSTTKSPIVIYSVPFNEIYNEICKYNNLNSEHLKVINIMIKDIINEVEKNLITLYSINKCVDIYIIGLPENLKFFDKISWIKDLKGQKLNIVTDILKSYNLIIKELSKKYNTTYINIEHIQGIILKNNVLASKYSHNQIADMIINKIYDNKKTKKYPIEVLSRVEELKFDEYGLRGILKDLILENNYDGKNYIKNNPFIYSEKYHTVLKAKQKTLK